MPISTQMERIPIQISDIRKAIEYERKKEKIIAEFWPIGMSRNTIIIVEPVFKNKEKNLIVQFNENYVTFIEDQAINYNTIIYQGIEFQLQTIYKDLRDNQRF